MLTTGYSLIVQWSRNERFVPESGEFVLCDGRKEITIPGLDKVLLLQWSSLDVHVYGIKINVL